MPSRIVHLALCLSILFLAIFLFFATKTDVLNELSESIFLTYHKNKLAINILEKLPGNKKSHYTYFLLGRIYFVENELEKSIENYNKSIALNPAHKESYYGLGLSFGFLSPVFYKDAQNNFEKYIELEEEEFEQTGKRGYGVWAGYNDLAWIHFLQGDFAKAEHVSKKALTFSPDNPWLLNMLAISLIEQGKCPEAYPLIQKAKNLAEKMSAEEFGEAYTGDNKNWWPKGLAQMKQTIRENELICANVK